MHSAPAFRYSEDNYVRLEHRPVSHYHQAQCPGTVQTLRAMCLGQNYQRGQLYLTFQQYL